MLAETPVEQERHQLLDPAGVVEARRQLVQQLTPTARAADPACSGCLASGIVATSAGCDFCERVAEGDQRRPRGLRRTGSGWRTGCPSAAALCPRLAISGVPWSASLPRSRPSAAAADAGTTGTAGTSAEMSLARAALATEVVLALCDEARRSAGATCASGASTASESVASCASCWFWRGEDLEHLVGVAERRDWRGG